MTKYDVLKATNDSIDEQNALVWKMEHELSNRMNTAIYDMLQEMGGECCVDFDTDDDYPLITYDGGRHAEYNSTICAVVTRVKATTKNGFKCFTIDIQDEEDDYESERLDHGDIATIFDFVKSEFEDKFSKEN